MLKENVLGIAISTWFVVYEATHGLLVNNRTAGVTALAVGAILFFCYFLQMYVEELIQDTLDWQRRNREITERQAAKDAAAEYQADLYAVGMAAVTGQMPREGEYLFRNGKLIGRIMKPADEIERASMVYKIPQS